MPLFAVPSFAVPSVVIVKQPEAEANQHLGRPNGGQDERQRLVVTGSVLRRSRNSRSPLCLLSGAGVLLGEPERGELGRLPRKAV